MKIEEIKKLEKELEKSGERMAEYRKNGNYEQEASEHAYYNEVIEKMNKLLEDKEEIANEIKDEISKLQEELKDIAERMGEYKKYGFHEQEAAEHKNYNDMVKKIQEFEKELEKFEKTIKKEKEQSNKKKETKWHPDLTPEQIEELEAEGIEPGDNEYRMYLLNHGINPNETKAKKEEVNKKKETKWNPDLTPEQIEELEAEGIEPGDNEYRMYLRNHGINPNENEGEKESDKDKGRTKDDEGNISLDEYNKMLEIYNEDLETLYELQQKYERQEIDYTDYEKHADYMVERYRFMMDSYKNVANMDNKEIEFRGIADDDLKAKLDELNAELTDEWNFRAHQENGMEEHQDDKLSEIQAEIDKIKAELEERKDNPLRGFSDQELEAKKKELYAKIVDPNEYHFRAHQENGMEGYEEDEIDKGLKEIRKEIERRAKEQEPEKPEQPMMIEKDREQEPSLSGRDSSEEEPKEFEEILYEIKAAKNAMSDAELGRYESAKGKWLVPVQYDKGDWLHNTARFLVKGVLGTVVNMPRKLYSMIRTRKKQKEKMENMVKNVDELSDKDFKVLVEGLQSYKGHENLVSASVRKAVQMRLEKEVRETNNNRDNEIHESLQNIKNNYDRSKQIEKELKKEVLSEYERNQLIEEKTSLDALNVDTVRNVEKLRKQGALEQGGLGVHGLEEESKAAREGSNLRGRKFARRYSTNEELEEQQAQLKKAQREARKKGDNSAEVEAFVKHEQLLENNTSTRKILGITVSRSDRHHEKGVFSKEYKEDDLTKNIATIAAVTATTMNMIKQIQNQAILNQKNAELAKANASNQAMATKGEGLRQDIINNDQVIQDGVSATNDTRTASAWAAGHEHAGAVNNFTNNWGSSNIDKAFHQIMSGTVDDNTIKTLISNGLGEIKKYAAAHPQFDYNALVNSLTNLGNGGVDAIAQYNSAMQTLVQNAVQTGQITSTSVGALSLSPTYIETMIPLVLAGKEVTSKEYRKAEKEAKKKEKKEAKKENKFKERLQKEAKKTEKESKNQSGRQEEQVQNITEENVVEGEEIEL